MSGAKSPAQVRDRLALAGTLYVMMRLRKIWWDLLTARLKDRDWPASRRNPPQALPGLPRLARRCAALRMLSQVPPRTCGAHESHWTNALLAFGGGSYVQLFCDTL
jgi:hypothetical protein